MSLDLLAKNIAAIRKAAGFNLDIYARNHPVRARKIGVWCLALGVTIGYGTLYYVFAALLFNWDRSLGWGKESLTFAFMISIFVAAAVSPSAGKVIDSGRGRWLLGGGMLLGGTALLGLGFVQTYTEFLICWILLGIAQGSALYDPVFAFVTRNTGQDAPRNITRITLAGGFASTMALPAGAFLAETYGWRDATLAFAAVAGLVGAPLAFCGATLIECCPERNHTSAQKAANKQALKAAIRRPEFWIIFCAFPLVGLAEGLILTHMIPILIDQGLALGQAVLVASLFGPLQVAGRAAMIFLTSVVRNLTITLLAVSGIAGSIILLTMTDHIPMLAYIFSLLFGASYGLISILKPVLTAEILGREGFGTISGYVAVPFLISLALSPYLGALLEAVGGYTLAMHMALLVTGISAALFYTLSLTQKSQPKHNSSIH